MENRPVSYGYTAIFVYPFLETYLIFHYIIKNFTELVLKLTMNEIYSVLADKLNALPNGFPRTKSGVELKLLERIFSQDEAEFAVKLPGEFTFIEEIADQTGLTTREVRRNAMALVKRELAWFDKKDGKPRFRIAPFIVGIYEGFIEEMDHEFAHLFEQYLLEGAVQDIMGTDPAHLRVVPSHGTVKTDWILPYDDIRKLIENAKSFRNNKCICRKQQKLVGGECEFPEDMCLGFSNTVEMKGDDVITREEAIALLDKAEEIGLVHCVSNIQDGVSYFCNCCGCCCTILRGITNWGINNSVAHANYFAAVDLDVCAGCEDCIVRCQVKAVRIEDDLAVVDKVRCIGCGLCVSTCSTGAMELVLKPEAEIVEPPFKYEDWERDRYKNRGIGISD